MNQHYFQSNWPWLQQRVHSRWPQLPEQDVDRIDGRIERLYTVLLRKGGMSRAQAALELWEFLHSGSPQHVKA